MDDSGFADGEWSYGRADTDTKAVFWNVPIELVERGEWAMVELGVFTDSESVRVNGKRFIRITWPRGTAEAVFLKK